MNLITFYGSIPSEILQFTKQLFKLIHIILGVIKIHHTCMPDGGTPTLSDAVTSSNI
jgi:hypothetical protein